MRINTSGTSRFGSSMTMVRVLATSAFAMVAISSLPAQVSFQALGDLPGGGVSSVAQAISADGSTVVGQGSTDSGFMAFRWTEAGGMSGLGFLAGGNESIAHGVSADGSVVVGQSNSTGFYGQAFRWTQATGMTGLGDLPGGDAQSVAHAVSADGSVVVGIGRSDVSDEAVRWTDAAGMERLHVHTGVSAYSGALAVSADGSVAGGFGRAPDILAYQAFLWEGGAATDLGVLPGASSYSFVHGLSSRGDVAVGWSLSATGMNAFRWSAAEGMVGLAGLPGEYFGRALAVSADGLVVVGTDYTDFGQFAFIWTEEMGMASMGDFLAANGVDTTGWHLYAATGISADGSRIVGNGVNPDGAVEAWLVNLAVSTDSDGDGINDEDDAFPNSDVQPTIIVGGIDTQVPNLVNPDGSTLADLVAQSAADAKNHGEFARAVAHLTNAWAADGLITNQQKGAIQKAAAKARVP